MSVREEDRQKNTCPSRGLGIAAAAIGVGVGAALYYFFSKRQENPNSEGSTSDWRERPQTFFISSDDSYTTVSEHETSDTSVHDSSPNGTFSEYSLTSSDEELELDSSESSDSDTDNIITNDVYLSDSTYETGYLTLQNDTQAATSYGSDSDGNEWDVTTSSIGVPEDIPRSPMLSLLSRIGSTFISPRKNRERAWSLEECSICFDVMLRDQEVTSLACAHNFHTECIMPWLQEKQTCPNCRKVA